MARVDRDEGDPPGPTSRGSDTLDLERVFPSSSSGPLSESHGRGVSVSVGTYGTDYPHTSTLKVPRTVRRSPGSGRTSHTKDWETTPVRNAPGPRSDPPRFTPQSHTMSPTPSRGVSVHARVSAVGKKTDVPRRFYDDVSLVVGPVEFLLQSRGPPRW